MTGRLIIFEGPDGTGKTTLSRRLVDWLTAQGQHCRYISFPGREEGTLGNLVYAVHHKPAQFGIHRVEPTARQLLHVAAHIDSFHTTIGPALEAGELIVMDRFWWSTVVYGRAAGVDDKSIQLMIDLEKHHWAGCRPSVLFLLDRTTAAREEQTPEEYGRLRVSYSDLAGNQEAYHVVRRVSTDHSPDRSFKEIVSVVESVLPMPKRDRQRVPQQDALPLSRRPATSLRHGPTIFAKLSPAVPSQVYDTYWRFATKRQEVFFRRFRSMPPPWSDDPILLRFKFTNAYRASDRVSQYLIRHVIYDGCQEPDEIFFRTILFKLFNKIETWQLLGGELGPLTTKTFDLGAFDRVLSAAMARKAAIYSAAYIMPSGGKYGEPKKHRNHLKLLKMMLEDGVPQRLTIVKRMRDAFDLLLSYPMIGDFLAYQYVTDLNYSSLTNFSEMEFVVPGPGARDGIRKCFTDLGGLTEGDIIKMVADRQEVEFDRLGLDFQSLWGRPLQLIDCQNLFCEVDKYARHAHPEIAGITGRTRIKQAFRSTPSNIEYWYPPKWGLNDLIAKETEATHANV